MKSNDEPKSMCASKVFLQVNVESTIRYIWDFLDLMGPRYQEFFNDAPELIKAFIESKVEFFNRQNKNERVMTFEKFSFLMNLIIYHMAKAEGTPQIDAAKKVLYEERWIAAINMNMTVPPMFFDHVTLNLATGEATCRHDDSPFVAVTSVNEDGKLEYSIDKVDDKKDDDEGPDYQNMIPSEN